MAISRSAIDRLKKYGEIETAASQFSKSSGNHITRRGDDSVDRLDGTAAGRLEVQERVAGDRCDRRIK